MSGYRSTIMADPSMSLLMRELGFNLGDLSTAPDPGLLRGLIGGLTIYRGDPGFQTIYDQALNRLMWKSGWSPWFITLSRIKSEVKDDPKQWPFSLADDEFAGACQEFFGDQIPAARKLYEPPGLRQAIVHDVSAAFVVSIFGWLAGAVGLAAGSAVEALRVGAPAIARATVSNFGAAAVGALDLKTLDAMHKRLLWARYQFEFDRRQRS